MSNNKQELRELCNQLAYGAQTVLKSAENKDSEFTLNEMHKDGLQKFFALFFREIASLTNENYALKVTFSAPNQEPIAIDVELNAPEEGVIATQPKSLDDTIHFDFRKVEKLSDDEKAVAFAKAVIENFPQSFFPQTAVSATMVKARKM